MTVGGLQYLRELLTKHSPTDPTTMPYAAAANGVPACPTCGGAMWDNRDSKRNPKAPDFKCKNKECLDERGMVTAIWERDVKAKGGTVARAQADKQPYSVGGPLPYETNTETGAPPAAASPVPALDALFHTYDVCFDHAHALAHKKLGNDASHEGIAAMAATLFIQASKR